MSRLAANRQNWLAQYYDKVLLVVMLLGLVVSAFFLTWEISRTVQQPAAGGQGSAMAAGKPARPMEDGMLSSLLAMFDKPYQAVESTNGLMVGELRVLCVNSKCRKPIPYAAERCPFCNAEQPPVSGQTAKNQIQVDPAVNLRVIGVVAPRFPLKFTGITQLGTNVAQFRFQLNRLDNGQSKFRRIGETVDGYKLVDYPLDQPRGRETLVLQKDGEPPVRLVKGKELIQEAVIRLVLPAEQKEFALKLNEVFELAGVKYRVIDIDRNSNSATIRNLQEKKDIPISLPAGEEHPPSATDDKTVK